MQKKMIYAARIKDDECLIKSSSGGMFTAIAERILELGGAVAGVIYDYVSNTAKYELISDREGLVALRGSKYMQADMNNIFQTCYEWVKGNSKTLVFFGLGCQAEAFRKFSKIKGIREQVLIVDIICFGIPSPLAWKRYISKVDCHNHGTALVTFKDKRNGWMYPYPYVRLNSGQEISTGLYVDIYNSGHIVRPSCFNCGFTKIDRKVDITIGDYWGIEQQLPQFYSNNGNSLLIIHSRKGEEVFWSISNKIYYTETDESKCLQPSLRDKRRRPQNYDKFWIHFMNEDVEAVLKKYSRPPLVEHIKRVIRKIVK